MTLESLVSWRGLMLSVAALLCGHTQGALHSRSDLSSLQVLPAASKAPPELPSHNFDDGTFGPWSNPFDGSTVRVVNDPTGKLSGKVVRIDYDVDPGVPDHQDRNRFFQADISAHNRTHVFVRCDFVLGTPTGNNPTINRKLLYIKSPNYISGNDKGWAVVVGLDDRSATDRGRLSTSYGEVDFFPASADYTVQYNRRYTLELELKRNSTTTRSDGLIRVWLTNDRGVTALAQERLNLRIATLTTDPIHLIEIGRQIDRFRAIDDVSELRYWDRCAVSSQRIGPDT